jgi:hypothetical protein
MPTTEQVTLIDDYRDLDPKLIAKEADARVERARADASISVLRKLQEPNGLVDLLASVQHSVDSFNHNLSLLSESSLSLARCMERMANAIADLQSRVESLERSSTEAQRTST